MEVPGSPARDRSGTVRSGNWRLPGSGRITRRNDQKGVPLRILATASPATKGRVSTSRARAPALAWSPELGWLAAVLAVITAYVRALGASAGADQHFIGPMAKQHRMALLTATCVIAIGQEFVAPSFPVFTWSLAITAAGCLLTIVRRCRLIVRDLEAQ